MSATCPKRSALILPLCIACQIFCRETLSSAAAWGIVSVSGGSFFIVITLRRYRIDFINSLQAIEEHALKYNH